MLCCGPMLYWLLLSCCVVLYWAVLLLCCGPVLLCCGVGGGRRGAGLPGTLPRPPALRCGCHQKYSHQIYCHQKYCHQIYCHQKYCHRINCHQKYCCQKYCHQKPTINGTTIRFILMNVSIIVICLGVLMEEKKCRKGGRAAPLQ